MMHLFSMIVGGSATLLPSLFSLSSAEKAVMMELLLCVSVRVMAVWATTTR